MESVATFMIVLIMKLMPNIKLCVPLTHGAITYKNTMIEVMCIVNGQYDAYFKRTIIMIIDLSVCIRKIFLLPSLFPSLCNHFRLALCPYRPTHDKMNSEKMISNVIAICLQKCFILKQTRLCDRMWYSAAMLHFLVYWVS